MQYKFKFNIFLYLFISILFTSACSKEDSAQVNEVTSTGAAVSTEINWEKDSSFSNASIASLLRDAADICKQSKEIMGNMCASMCTSSAKDVETDASLAANTSGLLGKITACMASFGSVGKDPELTQKFTQLQTNLLMNQPKINFTAVAQPEPAPAQQTAAAPAQPELSPSKVDTNYFNADGTVNGDKLLALLDANTALCGIDQQQSFAGVCRSSANTSKSSLQRVFELYPNEKLHEDNVFFQLQQTAKNFAQWHNMPLADSVKNRPEYIALNEFIQSIKDDKWPVQPEAPALDLTDLLAGSAPQETQKSSDILMLAKQLVSKNVSSLPSFQEAQRIIQSSPEFVALKAEADKENYNSAQLRQALDNLDAKRSSMNSNEWRKQSDRITNILIQKELVEASTQSCDQSYLASFNADRRWKNTYDNPVRASSLTVQPQNPPNITHLIEAPMLHRLCALTFAAEFTSKFKNESDKAVFEKFTAEFMSRPLLAGGIGNMGAAPRRIMSDQEWLPFVQQIATDFEGKVSNQEFVNALLAALDKSGFAAWVKAQPNQVSGAQTYYQAVARSAQYKLDQAAKDPESLAMSRYKSNDSMNYQNINYTNLRGSYATPKYSFEEPRNQVVAVFNEITCTKLPALLSKLINQPASMAHNDYLLIQQTLRTCGGISVPWQYKQRNQGNTFFTDYSTALSINSPQGKQAQATIKNAAQVKIDAQNGFFSKLTGLGGFNFDDAYGAWLFLSMFEAIDKVMRNSYYQQAQVDFSAANKATESYYQAATKYGFNDLQPIAAIVQQKAEQEKQEALLQKINNPTGQATQTQQNKNTAPTDKALIEAYYLNKCVNNRGGYGSSGVWNCGCLAKGYVAAVTSGAVTVNSKESDFMDTQFSSCFNRTAFQQGLVLNCKKGYVNANKDEKKVNTYCGCRANLVSNAAKKLQDLSGFDPQLNRQVSQQCPLP